MSYLLSLLILVPVLGAVVAAVLPRAQTAKLWSLTVAAVTGALALGLAGRYLNDVTPVVAPAADSWLSVGPIHFSFSLGIDAISLFLVLMTVMLVMLAITASFDSITDRPRQYYAWMLGLLASMLGVFLARDLLLFYAFFELTLVPSFFLIGVWGGPDRRGAATKFFIYTFSASVFTLAAIVYLGGKAGTFDLESVVTYAQTSLSADAQFWVALGLFAAFVVKSAVFPLHTWLPGAYTEAPTPATVILAGVMPKLGTYGILRLVIPIGLVTAQQRGESTALSWLIGVVGVLAVVGILYGAMIAWVQRDMKRLLAYSSFSHLGFCVLGLMALNAVGLQGSVLYMLNHGISTGALFLCSGMIFDRFRTNDQYDISGLTRVMPKMAFFFVLFAMSSIGLPGLNGFVSEFLTILGAFTANNPATPYNSVFGSANGPAVLHTSVFASSGHLGIAFGVLAALGIILAAIYMLQLVQQLFFGPLKMPAVDSSAASPVTASLPVLRKNLDLTHRELAILSPLAVLVVVLGFFPGLVLDPIRQPVEKILTARVSPNVPLHQSTTPAVSPETPAGAPPGSPLTGAPPSVAPQATVPGLTVAAK